MSWFDLGGRNAIVTGGNTGLGQAFTLALAKAGAERVRARASSTTTAPTRALVEAEGVRYEFMEADITGDGRARRRSIDTCVERLGSVDILVNSAGICPLAEVLDFGRDKWDATVAVNLTAAFEMSYEAAKRDGAAAQRQDHQHLLDVQLPRRPPVAGLRGHQARHRRAHEGVLRRARRAQHPGQRHRPRLLRDGDHRRTRAATPTPTARCSTTSRPNRWGETGRPDGHRRVPRRAGPPTTSTATSSRSTAATSSAEAGERQRWRART